MFLHLFVTTNLFIANLLFAILIQMGGDDGQWHNYFEREFALGNN